MTRLEQFFPKSDFLSTWRKNQRQFCWLTIFSKKKRPAGSKSWKPQMACEQVSDQKWFFGCDIQRYISFGSSYWGQQISLCHFSLDAPGTVTGCRPVWLLLILCNRTTCTFHTTIQDQQCWNKATKILVEHKNQPTHTVYIVDFTLTYLCILRWLFLVVGVIGHFSMIVYRSQEPTKIFCLS